LKRAYEKPSAADGKRILVERLWPRGLTKAKARIDLWLKDIAPSTELRRWYSHDVSKWREFKKRYLAELRDAPESMRRLRGLAQEGPVTLIYAAHDVKHNSAVVLQQLLDGKKSSVASGRKQDTVAAKRGKDGS
jgi:uncharacterized protein YeaO (DUF488 family)